MAVKSILTPAFRVSFPNVFKARLNELSGKEEYSLVALFPLDADLKELKALAMEVAKAKWPKSLPPNFRSPFRKQDEREKVNEETGDKFMPDGYTRGAVFLNLKSQRQPGIVDQRRQAIISPEDFYAGCWARASVTCYAYDQKGNRGVSFGLSNLQKVRDDDPFSGRRKAEDEFGAIEGADGSDDTSTASTDDIFG
jgi:hypothetical protein